MTAVGRAGSRDELRGSPQNWAIAPDCWHMPLDAVGCLAGDRRYICNGTLCVTGQVQGRIDEPTSAAQPTASAAPSEGAAWRMKDDLSAVEAQPAKTCEHAPPPGTGKHYFVFCWGGNGKPESPQWTLKHVRLRWAQVSALDRVWHSRGTDRVRPQFCPPSEGCHLDGLSPISENSAPKNKKWLKSG